MKHPKPMLPPPTPPPDPHPTPTPRRGTQNFT